MKKRMIFIVCVALMAVLAVGYFGKPLVSDENGDMEKAQASNPAIKDGKWDVTQLSEVKAGRFPQAPAGVYMTLKEITEDSLLVEMHNDTAESWTYGDDGTFRLVKLEGTWYRLPSWSGASVLIAHPLDPGAVIEESFSLSGSLPAGTYRLVKEIYQGAIPENTFVQRYLTVEFEIP